MYFEIADITASIWLLLAWGMLVGFVFSTVGAAGGILASVGLISVFGVEDANLVKPMAQSLTLVTPLIAVPLYIRQCRVVSSIALLLGLGGVMGAMLGSYLSLNYLSDMSVFKPVFAGLIFLIAGQIAWQLWQERGPSSEQAKSVRAAELYQLHMQDGGKSCEVGVHTVNARPGRITIEFGEEKFSFNPLLPLFSGVAISVLSSAFGVGGGFLLVPFMSIMMGLPMFIVAGTAALAVAIHSLASISNYIRLGVELDYPLLGLLMLGVAAGSMVGPHISKYIPEKGLRVFLLLVLLLIGLRYTGIF